MDNIREEARQSFIMAAGDRLKRYAVRLELATTEAKRDEIKVLIRRTMDYRSQMLAKCKFAEILGLGRVV